MSASVLLFGHHIGALQCYKALFENRGWRVDMIATPSGDDLHLDVWRIIVDAPSSTRRARVIHYLRRSVGMARGWRRRWRLFKWICFHVLLMHRREHLGERRYFACLNALNRLRLIDDRWYLHAALMLQHQHKRWKSRNIDLSPETRQALRHPAVARLAAKTDLVVVTYVVGRVVDLALALNDIHGLKSVAISYHRFNQGKSSRAANEQLKADTLRFVKREGCVKAVADDYDWHYEKHYLDIDAHRLWARPFHVRCERAPEANEAAALLTRTKNKAAVDDLLAARSASSRLRLDVQERMPYFGGIEELGRYRAFIVLPYSAWASMHIELYALNRPVFIPSVEFIIQHDLMWDRALASRWCTEADYRAMADDADDADSPNSMLPEAQRLWVARGFLHSREHCRVFEDWDDLFDQLDNLEEADCRDIAAAMREENERLDAETLAAWDKALKKLDLSAMGERR